MKRLAVLFLLVALPATAQQPVITDFNTNGFVTWTNPDTNAFLATDWTWNLRYNWIEMDSVARATQALMHTSMWDVGDPSVDLEGGLMNLRTYAHSMGDKTDALFVRIRTSPDPPSCGSVTNWLRVCNASTSTVESLTFGIESSIGNRWPQYSVDVPMLPAQSNTAFHAMSFAWPNIFGAWGGETDAARYFIDYTHNGD